MVAGPFFFCPAGSTLGSAQWLCIEDMVDVMAESKWAAIGPDWYRDAACAHTDSDQFSPVVESLAALAKVREEFCDHCPVRDRCLQSAIINDDRGFWGGTTTSERQAMRRIRSRAKCPIASCRAPDPVILGAYQVCIRCGASWQTDKAAPAPQRIADVSLPEPVRP